MPPVDSLAPRHLHAAACGVGGAADEFFDSDFHLINDMQRGIDVCECMRASLEAASAMTNVSSTKGHRRVRAWEKANAL